MKNSTILLAAVAIFYITGCTQPKVADMLKDDAQKKEIFSAILSNEQASSELMDSFMMNYHEQVMTKMNDMMKSDQNMQTGMMDNMMSMCNSDTSMCKVMMNKTMGMCDADQSKCKMMMGSMQEHPKGMKTMKDMGMCDMKAKPQENNEEHLSQHH